MALACTHFPLLAAELAAASPRPCVWLDSGEAIARRLAHVLIAGEGTARVRRAAFTNADAARSSFRAFEGRGFEVFASISSAPGFEASPIPGFQSA